MLCLIMRLYPTFSPPGLLSTFARHVLNNIPLAACHSYNLGSTSSETCKVWKWNKTMILHLVEDMKGGISLSCLEAEAL